MQKPIILFDLNGTLCYRNKSFRKTYTRPFIKKLKELKELYTLGIYTSMMEYNALKIIKQIEEECKAELFDRNYIFTRDATIEFTEEELNRYNIPYWKTKKSINHVIKDPNQIAIIVDDEEVKIVEKDLAIIIPSYYEVNYKDRELYKLVNSLMRGKTPMFV